MKNMYARYKIVKYADQRKNGKYYNFKTFVCNSLNIVAFPFELVFVLFGVLISIVETIMMVNYRFDLTSTFVAAILNAFEYRLAYALEQTGTKEQNLYDRNVEQLPVLVGGVSLDPVEFDDDDTSRTRKTTWIAPVTFKRVDIQQCLDLI